MRRQLGIVVDSEPAHLQMPRLRRQPDRHPRDDAHVRLCEQTIEIRSDAPARRSRGLRVRKSGEPCLDAFTRRQDDLECADMSEAVAVRAGSQPALDHVADETRIHGAAR